MDLGMPGMGGLKGLKAILALNPQAKIIVASGYASQDRVSEARQAGAADFVAKPYRRADLNGCRVPGWFVFARSAVR